MATTITFHAFLEKEFHIEIHEKERPLQTLGTRSIGFKPNPNREVKGSYVQEEIEVTQACWRDCVKFQFIVKMGYLPIYERSVRCKGNSVEFGEDIRNMNQPPIITPEYCISMGMFIPNSRISSELPNNIQIYVCVTCNYSQWMKELFRKINLQNTRLRQLILPGSHDSGMYRNSFPVAINNIADTQKDDVVTQLKLGARFFDYRPGTFTPEFISIIKLIRDSDYIYELTKDLEKKQVDRIPKEVQLALSMLFPNMGAFGNILSKMVKLTINEIVETFTKQALPSFEAATLDAHHIHALIPGESMSVFIKGISSFLSTNPQEIVVVKISRAGILDNINIPKVDKCQLIVKGRRIDGESLKIIKVMNNYDIFSVINDLLKNTGIQLGDHTSLNSTVGDLIAKNKRLIVIFQQDDQVLSSYNDDYLSCDAREIAKSIRNTANRVDNEENRNKMLIDMQLQLTASGQNKALMAGCADTTGFNATSSPLMGTKARTDLESYQLICDLINQYANRKGMATFINDFYDNGLTSQVVSANFLAAKLRERTDRN